VQPRDLGKPRDRRRASERYSGRTRDGELSDDNRGSSLSLRERIEGKGNQEILLRLLIQEEHAVWRSLTFDRASNFLERDSLSNFETTKLDKSERIILARFIPSALDVSESISESNENCSRRMKISGG